ncbi:MAG: hypothetical protein R2749_05150 [Acidimicrobiales bacterium]
MAKKTISFDTPFRKGEQVTATVDLPGVPEGTIGKVKVVNGMTWKRYWVFFDNGAHLGQVDHNALVRTKQWAAYQEHRSSAATAGAAKAEAAAASNGDGAAAADAAGGGSRIPEHLLERARNRKKALGID